MTSSNENTSHADPTKVALVTGTSSGIGFATALALARAGWRTVATVRTYLSADTLRREASTAGLTLDVQLLDVTDADGVEAVLDHIDRTYGRLDAIVNNAGSAALGTVELMSMADIRASMDVNFLGAVTVTRAALPLLRATRGRVLSVSSVGGAVGQPFNEAYCAAKFALEGFMESLHPVAASVGVAVTIVEPAAVSSAFVANAGIDQAALLQSSGPYRPALARSLDRTMRQFDPQLTQSPADVAGVILGSLESPTPAFRVQTSAAARAFVGVKLSDLDGSQVTGLTSSWVAG